MSITTLALIVLFPFLVWRIYSRLKTQMTRQRSILSRHYTGAIVFVAALLVPGSQLADNPFGLAALAALAAGAIAGIALANIGLRRTRVEVTPEGYFFTPPSRMGILVAMVLVARVLYLGLEFYLNQGTGRPYPRFTDSPLTLLSLGITAAYFATFSISLIRWRQSKRKDIERT